MDNCPKRILLALALQAKNHGVILEFIRPGKPTQYAFIESGNGRTKQNYRILYLFRTLSEVRESVSTV
ncbi:integrase core domain-containing protein [Kosakonia sacchari]|uniref:integrase core domain-containing protein n=1 Tax=Kosakonia sacchari TaxID=1158459 RepID=UPI003A0FE0AE